MQKYSQNRRAFAELYYLHVLVGVVHHAEVLQPLEPRRNVCGQVAAKELRGQRVKGADGNGDLHVHARGSHKKAHALQNKNTELNFSNKMRDRQ